MPRGRGLSFSGPFPSIARTASAITKFYRDSRTDIQNTFPDPAPMARRGEVVIKLATERKHLTNVLKMVAYNIESDLVQLIRPHYKRAEDEGRTFIQSALQDAADLEPMTDELHIRLAPLSSPHRTRVLEALCAALNETNSIFPGTRLRMRYSVASSS